jgi:hypothetical protein
MRKKEIGNERSSQINCTNCSMLGKCGQPLICIKLDYNSFSPIDPNFCNGCEMQHQKKYCMRHSEPCWKQERDISKEDPNWDDYNEYYYGALLYFDHLIQNKLEDSQKK